MLRYMNLDVQWVPRQKRPDNLCGRPCPCSDDCTDPGHRQVFPVRYVLLERAKSSHCNLLHNWRTSSHTPAIRQRLAPFLRYTWASSLISVMYWRFAPSDFCEVLLLLGRPAQFAMHSRRLISMRLGSLLEHHQVPHGHKQNAKFLVDCCCNVRNVNRS